MRETAAAAASYPASKKIAPNIASNPSAKMEDRRNPPVFNSPDPKRKKYPRFRPGVVKHARDRAIENRVAEKFQALVVIRTRAAMRKGGMAKQGVRKHVAEGTLDPNRQLIRLALWNHRTFTVFSKCTESETLAT